MNIKHPLAIAAIGGILLLALAVPLAFATDSPLGHHLGQTMRGDHSHRGGHGGAHHAAHHGGAATTQPPNTSTVLMEASRFNPVELTVKMGTPVTWRDLDAYGHTVTSDTGGELASPLLGEGESWTHTFTKPGTYRYHCEPHASADGNGKYRGMTGIVRVTP